jgi:hypothetical protein
MPSRHGTERGSAGSTSQIITVDTVDPALPRSVLCLPGIGYTEQIQTRSLAFRLNSGDTAL